MRKLFLIFMLVLPIRAFAQPPNATSTLVVIPEPCTAFNQYDFKVLSGGNADPTILTWGGCQAVAYVFGPDDTTAFSYAEVNGDFSYLWGSPYTAFIEGEIGAPNGCGGPNELLARGYWYQGGVYHVVIESQGADPFDAYLDGFISCYGLTCDYAETRRFFGEEGIARDPIKDGVPLC